MKCRAFIITLILFVSFGVVFGSEELSEYYGFDEMETIKIEWGIKNLQVCDLNGDGRNDIVISNNSKSKIELFLQRATVSPDEQEVTVDPEDIDVNAVFANLPTRFKRDSLAISQTVYSLVCGDLNFDGMMDLAYYGDPKSLYVLLQKEDDNNADDNLSWQSTQKIKIDDGQLSSNCLACADLNNDGKSDLALGASDGVYIILQKKDGTLAEPVKYPSTERILAVKCDDLNGDRVNDLVLLTADSDKPVYVRFGLSNGQLGALRQLFIERPLAWTFKLVDVDDQPVNEILCIDAKSGRLVCYKFSVIEGAAGRDWPIMFYPLSSGDMDTKRDLVTGDFDGDKLEDVVISDGGSAELILYKQKKNLGLLEPVNFPAFSEITSLSAADVDRDGKSEVAILSVKEKIIGLADFEDNRFSFPEPLDITGEPLAMELSDMDNDKKIDCAYIAYQPDDKKRYFNVLYDVDAAEHHDDGPGMELNDLKSNPAGISIVDVDQDGLKDVLVFVPYDSPILVRQTEKKEFEVADSPDSQSSLIKDASESSLAVADVDGKKGAELLIARNNFARSLVFEDGRWKVVDQYNAKSTENRISAVSLFDIDGRGSIFLLDGQKSQLQMLRAGDDRTYRVEKETSVGRWDSADHLKMLYGKFSGTGEDNILLFDSRKFALLSVDKTDVGRDLESLFSYETKIKDGSYGNLTAGDINSDGRTDIVLVEFKNNHIEIITLDREQQPVVGTRFKIFEEKSAEESTTSRTSVEPRELALEDVTGDGKNDLVTVIHDRIIIYPQD